MADHLGRVTWKGAGTLLVMGVVLGGCGVLVGFCPVLVFIPLLDKIQQWFISSQKLLLLLLP